ncbi:hypothetical protein C8R43DRAFT_1133933 [Mycena crocata]|nr:hypothetical protein C8R43DRAFT_1133933 [Mycena crocata]
MVDIAQGRHDAKYYFKDGNIVLSAKDSDNQTTYFRWYRDFLAGRSSVFADTFSMPPPPTIEQYDGVPLVQMPDDAGALGDFIALLHDLEHLSRILEDDDFILKMLNAMAVNQHI